MRKKDLENDESIFITTTELTDNSNEEGKDITLVDTLSTTANITGKYLSKFAKNTYDYVSNIDWEGVKQNIDYGRNVLLTNVPPNISEKVPNILRRDLSSDGSSFKDLFSFNERQKFSNEMRIKFPNSIPIIVEKSPWSKIVIPKKIKHRYIAPFDLNCRSFIFSVRKYISNAVETESLYFSCGGMNLQISSSTRTMKYYYDNFVDNDGFLYINFFEENVYG